MVMRTILRQRLPRHVLTSTTRSRVQQAPYLRSLTRFEAPKQAQEEEPLEETLRKLRNDDKESSERQTSNNNAFNTDDIVRNLAEKWRDFQTGVGETWQELLQSGERQSINKRIKTGPAYTGPIDIMVIDESEGLTAWERMQKRLTEAPVISEILSRSGEIYEKSGAKQVHQRAKEVSEDAREAWETSQNPWVYRISSVNETVTADTPEALAVAELQKLDPTFNLEEWRRDVVEHTLPQIMSLFLEGKIEELSPWLGEGVYMRLAAEMKAREQEGVQINTHVLGIMNSEILACEVWK